MICQNQTNQICTRHLFFIPIPSNDDAQAEGAGDDDIGMIEFLEQLDGLLCETDAHPEAVIHIASHQLQIVLFI